MTHENEIRVDMAKNLAEIYLGSVQDAYGRPYHVYMKNVIDKLDQNNYEELCAGWLCDIFNYSICPDEIIEPLFGTAVYNAVHALTYGDLPHDKYMENVCKNPIAVKIEMAILSVELGKFGDEELTRMSITRYQEMVDDFSKLLKCIKMWNV